MLLLIHVSVAVLVYVNGCPIVNYTGIVNITNGGRVCQSWAGQEPHKHTSNNDAMFVHDGSVEEARNYCRQLVDDPRPWCYTIDIYKRWEHCDLQICDGSLSV